MEQEKRPPHKEMAKTPTRRPLFLFIGKVSHISPKKQMSLFLETKKKIKYSS
jgi:hypothetical protein